MSLEPSLFQPSLLQPQLSQPVHKAEVLYPSDHPHYPPLDLLEQIHVLFRWNPQNWMKYSIGITQELGRGEESHLKLLTTLLMQSRIGLAFWLQGHIVHIPSSYLGFYLPTSPTPFFRVAFNPPTDRPLSMFDLALAQVQDLV